MKILYLDTSSSFLYTAILEDDEVIIEIKEKLENNLSVYTLPRVEEMLKKANVDINKIDKIVAVNGTSDTNSYNSIKGLYGEIRKYGNMIIVPINGGHTIQNGVYSKTITINKTNYANLLEYCLQQTKA